MSQIPVNTDTVSRLIHALHLHPHSIIHWWSTSCSIFFSFFHSKCKNWKTFLHLPCQSARQIPKHSTNFWCLAFSTDYISLIRPLLKCTVTQILCRGLSNPGGLKDRISQIIKKRYWYFGVKISFGDVCHLKLIYFTDIISIKGLTCNTSQMLQTTRGHIPYIHKYPQQTSVLYQCHFGYFPLNATVFCYHLNIRYITINSLISMTLTSLKETWIQYQTGCFDDKSCPQWSKAKFYSF